MTKAEIEALGYVEIKMPGRHRFAKGLTRKARAAIARKQQFWSGTGKERVDRGLWEAAQ